MGRGYLVTGGAGFIGSHLVDALLARGDNVVVLDDLSAGTVRNLDTALTHPHCRFEQHSVLDELMVDELVRECEVVVHLAAAVGVRLVVEAPLRSFTTNIRGSEIVFEAAHRYGRQILVTTSSEVYGKNPGVPLREDADRVLGRPSVTRWAYSSAKAVDEVLAYAYHRERGLPTTVVRLFNTVGPRQSARSGMVVPSLVRQAVAGQPLRVFGDGRQTRCFCHVGDVVRALLLLLDEPRANGEVFNVGSQQEISILGLARRIIELAGTPSPVELVPYSQVYGGGFEDMRRRVPDTGKIRALTGWRPARSLDDILVEALAEAAAEQAEIPARL